MPSNISINYIDWLTRKDSKSFLEFSKKKISQKDIYAFINKMNKSQNNILFGIFYYNKHIGNIKIGPINWDHGYCKVGYLVGEQKFRNIGMASKSVFKCLEIAFNILKLRKCYAACYSNNFSSIKVLENNKFKLVARLPRHYIIKKKIFADHLHYLKNNKNLKDSKKSKKIKSVEFVNPYFLQTNQDSFE